MRMFYAWAMPDKCTFNIKPIKEFILKEIVRHKRILIPFAGWTRFHKPGITYIDIESNRPKPYIQGDCLEILGKIKQKYDLIILDPPFTYFQAVRTYHNKKLQEISIIKNLCDRLLKPRGVIIHCGYNTTGMGKKRGYKKTDLLIVNTGGSHNDFLILKERKIQTKLMEWQKQ